MIINPAATDSRLAVLNSGEDPSWTALRVNETAHRATGLSGAGTEKEDAGERTINLTKSRDLRLHPQITFGL